MKKPHKPRRFLADMYPHDIVNMVKLESNDMEAKTGVDLIKLIEEGFVEVVGVMDDQLLYQAALDEESQAIQA